MKQEGNPYAIAKVTDKNAGIVKGRRYKVLTFGFYRGGYLTIINGRGETLSVYDYQKYLDASKTKLIDR